jgi:DNA-binding IclR family transcriptional regulator
MSRTVAKALSILEHFSEEEPEFGLSELARRAGVDKATVYRIMVVLADAGFVEQRSDSKMYRLGAGVLRLARIREKSFPVTDSYQAALNRLTETSDETSHAALISGRALATIAVRESTKSSRVSLVAGEILPFHSTASGIAVMSFADPKLRDRVLASSLEQVTGKTITHREKLEGQIADTQARGFAEGDQTNEDDVFGLAAPVFDQSGIAVGSIAVATPAHRMTDDLHQLIVRSLIREAGRLTMETGGRLPPTYTRLLSTAL